MPETYQIRVYDAKGKGDLRLEGSLLVKDGSPLSFEYDRTNLSPETISGVETFAFCAFRDGKRSYTFTEHFGFKLRLEILDPERNSKMNEAIRSIRDAAERLLLLAQGMEDEIEAECNHIVPDLETIRRVNYKAAYLADQLETVLDEFDLEI